MKRVFDNKSFAFMVSLDIKGAFDSARYDIILQRLRNFEIPPNIYAVIVDYFKDRIVELPLLNVMVSKRVTGGCPQGGKISPLLWNVLLDDLLKLPLPSNCFLQAYADDTILFCEHRSIENCAFLTNNALQIIEQWGLNNGLVFNPMKTQAMMVTKRRNFVLPDLFLNGHMINIVRCIKILGVLIDSKLTWNDHISYIKSKAMKIYNLIRWKHGSNWGLSFDVLRTIYLQAIEPIILYACPVWSDILNCSTKCCSLLSLQRCFAISMIRAYRTVSLEAALVIANIPPIDLKILYFTKIFAIKHGLSSEHIYQLPVDYSVTVHPAKFNILFDFCGSDVFDNDRNSSGYTIYTDGSKINDEVGSAVVIFANDEKRSPLLVLTYRLNSNCSVYQAELFGICNAISWVIENGVSDAVILSDSKSAIQSICNFHSTNFLVQLIFKMVADYTGRICIKWIKAHNGCFGNDLADFYAKQATLLMDVSFDLLPLSFAHRNLKSLMINNWQQNWTTTTNGSCTKKFFPTIQHRLDSCLIPGFIITQFLTNHGKFNQYLSRFRISNSSVCNFCSCQVQSSLHLINNCNRFAYERFNFYNLINSDDCTYFCNSNNFDHFLKFVFFIYNNL
ncbi:hypothetical protein DERP_014546 [Dermatophagoides pteronyssinus]|uniref:RNA-directed DNA polymerase from mobile element jockey n=1 Tax=Dermatophagoides pteronyssinus TaxID=6956 RepID=A0ABQ8J1R1_DERPT|nr:hypothetical protein DERP_014546 [Dermatophagoides pteronyssinus]